MGKKRSSIDRANLRSIRKVDITKCIVCGKIKQRKGRYELCSKHYIDLTNTTHKSSINIKKVIILMKQIRAEYSPSVHNANNKGDLE